MLYRLLTWYIELIAALQSKYATTFTKKILKQVEYHSDKQFKKYLILCIYDTVVRPDIISLLKHLVSDGFGVIGVVSNNANEQYEDLLDITVHIAPIGRDFFAYQQGYEVLKKLKNLQSIEQVCFLNDSVWYFQKYQPTLVKALSENNEIDTLIVGTEIFDEIPHVSGWFFTVPFNSQTQTELNSLFSKNFATKSRMYNIRKGEHQIAPSLKFFNQIKALDPEAGLPYAGTYKAVKDGVENFYMKADCSFRTNCVTSSLKNFLVINTTGEEYNYAYRWLTLKADNIQKSKLRVAELSHFKNRYFPDKT